MKRLLDIVIAGFGLLVTAPLFAIAALRIKLEDRGPVFYRGERIGRDGQPFGMYKFRSMVVNADRLGGPSTPDDDPRLTKAGAFLRRSKLDELPQLLNVLRGEMSLVGPRPQVAQDVQRYTEQERLLLSVRPGITDWASVRYREEGRILAGHADPDRAYDELIRPGKIQLGLLYVRQRSVLTDLEILGLTALTLVRPQRTTDLLERFLAHRTPFRALTEVGTALADADQLEMARLRHSLVAELARGRDLLDVACGSGYALPLIGREAGSVTACDLDPLNVRDAQSAFPGGAFHVADAERPPLPGNAFDVVACLESIYYFHDWKAFVSRAHELLRANGTLIVTWPNPERPGFDRSPNSTTYPTAAQMQSACAAVGFTGTTYGAFPFDTLATRHRPVLDAMRAFAVRYRLIPRSMRLRTLVKRVIYRRMRRLNELTLLDDPRSRLAPAVGGRFTMLYYIGTKACEG